MEKLYVVYLWGCVKPHLHGPYDNEEQRIEAAKKLFTDESSNGPGEDQVFRLDIDEHGNPSVSAFTGGEMEDDDE